MCVELRGMKIGEKKFLVENGISASDIYSGLAGSLSPD